MAQLVVLLLVVAALAGAGGTVLVRRRQAHDPASVATALSRAAAQLAAGKPQRARRRYARLAKRLAAAPEALRPQRGLALLGQAEAATAAGDAAATSALHREAFPLLSDPARQLPRWSLRRMAEERMRAPDGELGPLLAFLRAMEPAAAGAAGTADGTDPVTGRGVTQNGVQGGVQTGVPDAVPDTGRALDLTAEAGADAATAALALDWLQRLCREGTPEWRETATAQAMAALPNREWPVLARAALLRALADRAAETEPLLAAAAPGGSGELWFRWGTQLYALHQDTPAVAALDEALRRGPGETSPWSRGAALRAEILLFRGLAQQRLGDTGAAWADLNAAATEAPADPRPRYALGRLALLLGADDRAQEQFAAALAARPSFAPARLGLALVHERAGHPAEAAVDYQAALALTPGWRPARVRLGAALLAAGRTAEAEPLLRAESGTDSRWGQIAAFHHGLALARTGDPAGALERWEPLRAADLLDRLALLRDRLARERLATDPVAARELWQRAAADDPAAPGYPVALAEAALREAAHLLVTGRDRAEDRDRAGAALDLADSLPVEALPAPRSGGASPEGASVGGAPPAGPATPRTGTVVLGPPPATGPAPGSGPSGRPAEAPLVLGRVLPQADPTGAPAPVGAAAGAGPATPAPAFTPAPGVALLRRNRLRAALALAEGSAERTGGLLEAAAAPRDRYHLAAVALLTGRPVQTIALLAPLEPDPAGDPGVARLRALLAERAGNWSGALEWHRHFLSAPAAPGARSEPDTRSGPAVPAARSAAASGTVPGLRSASATDPDPAGPPSGTCTTCEAPATATCGGCGREGCAAHLHRPGSAASPRCVHCAAPALRAVLDCARRAGLPEQAEDVLADWAEALGDSPAAAPVRFDLALLRAELGLLDAALAQLPDTAGRERAAVLVRRAAAALEAGEAGRAAADLRRALEPVPDHPQAAAALGLLAEHEARQHAVDGRHREAWEGYRALLLKDPAHPRLLHALGLAGYRLAAPGAVSASVSASASASGSTTEGAGSAAPGAAAPLADEQLWAWTVGCLTAALHLPDLWAEAARVTGRPAEEQRVAAARTALLDRLRTDLRELDVTRGRSGDELDAWTVRLGMETHCAAAFAGEDARITLPDRPLRRLVIGPLLHRELCDEPGVPLWERQFNRAVRAWRGEENHPLGQSLGLFDELGPQRYLLLQGRQSAAVSALDAIAGGDRGEAWRDLLTEALVGQAREHHRHQEWREALDCLARVRTVPGVDLPSDVADIAAESGVRAARALLKASDDDQEGAAKLLEQALELAPDHPEVRGDLGATYAQWARKINNENKDYFRALALLRKGMALAPEDPTARHFLEAVLGNRAGALTEADAPEADLLEAAELWKELHALNPDADHLLGYVFVMRHLARHAAMADKAALAVSRMTAALEADPEWTGETGHESRRRVSVMLANHMLDDMTGRPFSERAAILRKARSFDDSVDIRQLMVGVWRSEAADLFEATRYLESTRLLEQALEFSPSQEETAKLHRELGVVYGSYAVARANLREFRQARELVKTAVQYCPDDRELKKLQKKISSLY
ncbi:hypothetical protein PUR61_08610 [Streptomyces sp. BE20]|uniref:hypothetical protein n=1 Tax=Streptomyces sp. BE20 TaxID=3002525 RepID=UPI002E79DCA2|nr:hypothetical protein [Streptomyces sp. BE20]MEE1822254.1 hypothetical protein [Streptomyces sp. BE20]